MPRIVPPAGPPRLLAFAQLANSLGDGAFYACSALFFTRVIGLSATQVGIALTIGWATGILAGVPLGHLADRFGPRRTAILLAVATAATLSMFLTVRSFSVFLLLVSGYACCQAGLASARQALLAGLVDPNERTSVRAHVQSTLNAGLAVGAGLGGLALFVDTRPAYLAVFVMDSASFLVSALVVRRLPEVAPALLAKPVAGAAASQVAGPPPPRWAVLRDRPYALATFLCGIMYLNMPLLGLALPLWIVHRTDAPNVMAAVLLLVNMLTVVLLQVRMARQVTDLASAARTSARAGWVMFIACVTYALSGSARGAWSAVAILLAGALVQVMGEMMQAASAWEVGFALAPADKQGQYQGFFGMAAQIARMLGPLLLTTLLINWGTPGWFVVGGLFASAGLAMRLAVRGAQRRGCLEFGVSIANDERNHCCDDHRNQDNRTTRHGR